MAKFFTNLSPVQRRHVLATLLVLAMTGIQAYAILLLLDAGSDIRWFRVAGFPMFPIAWLFQTLIDAFVPAPPNASESSSMYMSRGQVLAFASVSLALHFSFWYTIALIALRRISARRVATSVPN